MRLCIYLPFSIVGFDIPVLYSRSVLSPCTQCTVAGKHTCAFSILPLECVRVFRAKAILVTGRRSQMTYDTRFTDGGDVSLKLRPTALYP
jgi:hypothetical protein